MDILLREVWFCTAAYCDVNVSISWQNITQTAIDKKDAWRKIQVIDTSINFSFKRPQIYNNK